MSPRISSTCESKVDDDENGDIWRRHVNDPGKSTNTKPLKISNPVPRLMTSNPRSSTTDILMQTTPGLSTALLYQRAASIANHDESAQKVFPHDFHLNRPINVGDFSLNPICATSIQPSIGSSPNSSQILVNGVASQLSVCRHSRKHNDV